MSLIDPKLLLEDLGEEPYIWTDTDAEIQEHSDWLRFKEMIERQPTVDAVSRGVFEQVKWERDVAIEQLESYGVSLGEKADVVKVVHGRWEQSKSMVLSYKCSKCKGWVTKHSVNEPNFNYCPNCGAKMDGDGNA